MSAPTRSNLVAVGFNVFLEHLLSYEEKSEKGEVHEGPRVHLGGGAFNLVKTLHSLGVPAKKLSLQALGVKEPTAQSTALEFLLKREPFTYTMIPILERAYSSYYLMSPTERTFAFGDRKMKVYPPSAKILNSLKAISASAHIKIATEVLANPLSIKLAAVLLKRSRPEQVSVVIPSRIALTTGAVKKLYPHTTLLSMNREEAGILFGTALGEKELLAHPVPYIFITNGPSEALLKAGERVYRASPKAIAEPKYEGGAGDAATATLVYELFIKKATPQIALKKALAVGTKVLNYPTPYLPTRA